MLTLVDELTLLSLGERSGKVVSAETAQRLPFALAGAMLMDLLLAGRVVLDGQTVRVVDNAQLPCPVLSTTLRTVAGATPQSQTAWIRRLAPDAHAALPQVLAGLVGRGVLRMEERGGRRTYPERDGAAEREARGRILAVVRGQAPPDFRSHVMVCLVHAAALVPELFPPAEHAHAARRVREIAAGVAVSGAMAQAGQAGSTAQPPGIPGGVIAAGAATAVGVAAVAAANVPPGELAERAQRLTAGDVAGGIGEIVEVAVDVGDAVDGVVAVVGAVGEIVGGIFSLFDW